MGSWLSQLWIYTTWGCFHSRFCFSDQISLEKNVFLKKLRKFSIIPNYIFKVNSIILKTLNSLFLRMLCAKCSWIWPNCSSEDVKNLKRLRTDRRQTKCDQRVPNFFSIISRIKDKPIILGLNCCLNISKRLLIIVEAKLSLCFRTDKCFVFLMVCFIYL